jgi:hypothetical protein
MGSTPAGQVWVDLRCPGGTGEGKTMFEGKTAFSSSPNDYLKHKGTKVARPFLVECFGRVFWGKEQQSKRSWESLSVG